MNLQGYKIQVAIIGFNPYYILIYKNKDDKLYYIWETHVYTEELYFNFYSDIYMIGFLTISESCFSAAIVKYTTEERRELMLKELILFKRVCINKLVEVYEQILNNYLFEVE
jgi:hypothetical protein